MVIGFFEVTVAWGNESVILFSISFKYPENSTDVAPAGILRVGFAFISKVFILQDESAKINSNASSERKTVFFIIHLQSFLQKNNKLFVNNNYH